MFNGDEVLNRLGNSVVMILHLFKLRFHGFYFLRFTETANFLTIPLHSCHFEMLPNGFF